MYQTFCSGEELFKNLVARFNGTKETKSEKKIQDSVVNILTSWILHNNKELKSTNLANDLLAFVSTSQTILDALDQKTLRTLSFLQDPACTIFQKIFSKNKENLQKQRKFTKTKKTYIFSSKSLQWTNQEILYPGSNPSKDLIALKQITNSSFLQLLKKLHSSTP